MSDKKLPPELQKLMEDEAEKDFQEYLDWAACYHNGGPSNTNEARREFSFGRSTGFSRCYQAMKAQAAKGFDSKAEFELAKKDYKAAHSGQDFMVTLCAGAQNAGKHLMYNRLMPAMQAKDRRIEQLETAIKTVCIQVTSQEYEAEHNDALDGQTAIEAWDTLITDTRKALELLKGQSRE